ncbi:two-component system, LuxR family, response regulator FixJ [Cohaesibacter sp. ES.047]|uniref:response regulator transcription factor n=1 Tax=Cohaesibacter sp. ES.047 TaxID=1798205 RepID=UPI000BB6C03B|nr:response regulator [Cohaesibacter sp. ES.047]SNY92591.1 two-component system, LuxR family, response regulator FixJ [Cohaesibacter sp. ES.047]
MNEDAVIHIVDDDRAVREGLGFMLSSLGLGIQTHGSAMDLLDRLDDAVIGCILADVRMPGMTGLELLDELNRRGCALPVIIITAHADVPMAVRAIQSGALDFFEKPVNGMALVERINEALKTARASAGDAQKKAQIAERIASLTSREMDVARAVMDGRQNKQIAADLGISPKTVEIHRHNLMAKMEATTTADLVRQLVTADWPQD